MLPSCSWRIMPLQGHLCRSQRRLDSGSPFLGSLSGYHRYVSLTTRILDNDNAHTPATGRKWAFNLTCLITSVLGTLIAAPPNSFDAVCAIVALSSFGLGGNIPIGMRCLHSASRSAGVEANRNYQMRQSRSSSFLPRIAGFWLCFRCSSPLVSPYVSSWHMA